MGNHIGVEFSRNYFDGYEGLTIVIVDENDEFKQYIYGLSERCGDFVNIVTNLSLTGHITVYTLKIANPDFKICNEKFKEYYGVVSHICVFGDFTLDEFELGSGTEVVKYEEDRLTFLTIDLLTNLDSVIFTNDDSGIHDNRSEFSYPAVLVLLDSSVTYYLADDTQDRVKFLGNSPIGPVSLLSLFKLFTMRAGLNHEDLNLKEIVKLSESGANTKCDMLVSDIYGDAYKEMGLPADLLASTFGKLQFSASGQTTPESGRVSETPYETAANLENIAISGNLAKSLGSHPEPNFSTEGTNLSHHENKHINNVGVEDFAKSLTLLLTINTTQIAYLHSQINNATSVIFVGSPFGSVSLRKKVEDFVKYWSSSTLRCYFCSINSINPLACALS